LQTSFIVPDLAWYSC